MLLRSFKAEEVLLMQRTIIELSYHTTLSCLVCHCACLAMVSDVYCVKFDLLVLVQYVLSSLVLFEHH